MIEHDPTFCRSAREFSCTWYCTTVSIGRLHNVITKVQHIVCTVVVFICCSLDIKRTLCGTNTCPAAVGIDLIQVHRRWTSRFRSAVC